MHFKQQAKIYRDELFGLAMEMHEQFVFDALASLEEALGITAMMQFYDMAHMTGSPEDVRTMVECGMQMDAFSLCFVAGTLIETKAGKKKIEDVQVGDLVLSRDEVTREQGYKTVTYTFARPTNRLAVLTYNSRDGPATVTGSPEHPFWSEDRKTWAGMGELRAGERLRCADGRTAEVRSVRLEERVETVYNFTVDGWHTYFATNDSLLLPRFKVGAHGKMPKPRPNRNSHHGVMSAWMKANYKNYNANKAPAVLMPTINHHKTYGVYLKWRFAMKNKMGGKFSWKAVSKAEIQQLGSSMFKAAKVPMSIQKQYNKQFSKMIQKLEN